MSEDSFAEVDLSGVSPDLIEWAQQQALIFDEVLSETIEHYRGDHDPLEIP